jgi:hypothetical protein
VHLLLEQAHLLARRVALLQLRDLETHPLELRLPLAQQLVRPLELVSVGAASRCLLLLGPLLADAHLLEPFAQLVHVHERALCVIHIRQDDAQLIIGLPCSLHP